MELIALERHGELQSVLGYHSGQRNGLVVAERHLAAPSILELEDKMFVLAIFSLEDRGVLQGGSFEGIVSESFQNSGHFAENEPPLGGLLGERIAESFGRLGGRSGLGYRLMITPPQAWGQGRGNIRSYSVGDGEVSGSSLGLSEGVLASGSS